MADMMGTNVLLQIFSGGVWIIVDGQTDTTITFDRDIIETSDKDGGGYREYEYGLGGFEISMEGNSNSADSGQQLLRAAWFDRTKLTTRCIETSGKTYSGTALVTSFEKGSPHDDKTGFSASLTGTGTPVET